MGIRPYISLTFAVTTEEDLDFSEPVSNSGCFVVSGDGGRKNTLGAGGAGGGVGKNALGAAGAGGGGAGRFGVVAGEKY